MPDQVVKPTGIHHLLPLPPRHLDIMIMSVIVVVAKASTAENPALKRSEVMLIVILGATFPTIAFMTPLIVANTDMNTRLSRYDTLTLEALK